MSKKPIIWLQLVVFATALLGTLIPAQIAQAAAGDPGDPNGVWLNHGAIKYNGKTYVIQDGVTIGGKQVFAVAWNPCHDNGTNETRNTDADGYLVVDNSSTTSQLLHIDPNNNNSSGGSNCQIAQGAPLGAKTVGLTSDNLRHTWFYRDGSGNANGADTIFLYNNPSVSFVRDRAFKPGGAYGGAEIYIRDGETQCADMLVKNGGTWLFFPMASKADVASRYPNSKSVNAISEDYNAITNDAQNLCRVDSEEVVLDYHLSQVAGVTTDESGPVFAGGEWNVKGGNYCNDIGGPLPKYLDHSGGGSNISGDYGYYVHDIILSCRNQGHGGLIKDDNFMIFARRGGQDNSHWSNGGGFTKTDLHIDVNGIYYFDPNDLKILHNDADDNGYTVVGGVSDVVPTNLPVPPPGSGGTKNGPAAKVDCNAGAFTWLICPIIHALVEITDWIRNNILIPFLKEAPLSTKSVDQAGKTIDNPAYTIWQSMRNIASVFFILVFFLIIIGTAAGFDNYTIKRVLPHLVAGAILVPFSWWICALVIDVSNVLGQGIVALVDAVPAMQTLKVDFTNSIEDAFFGATGIMAVTIAYFAFAGISLALLVTILLGLFSAVLTLLLRKVLIILFIVISPFALLAWVLPNTEKWFNRWWSNFFRLCMMYPFIMIFIESGRILSATAGAALGAKVAFLNQIHFAALGVPGLGAINLNAAQIGAVLAPIVQLVCLYLPDLFIPKLLPKMMGEAGAAGMKGINAARGAAEKQWGKDSDMAKMAAENKVRNSIRRDREYNDKAAAASGLNKKRLQALSRFNARRAGVPRGFQWTGGKNNVSRELQRESMYSKAQGEQGIHNANAANAKEALPKETEADRIRAETRMAQVKKINERAQRMGLLADMDQTGKAGVVAGNRSMYNAGLDASKRQSATDRGNAIGAERAITAMPQNAKTVTKAAAITAQTKASEERGTTVGTIAMNNNLDKLTLDAEHAAGRTGVTLEDAHRLRMQNIAKNADLKAGKAMLQSEIETKANTTSDEQLNNEVVSRVGGSIANASRLRTQNALAAGVSKGRKANILSEAEDRTYNEVERAAGGGLSTNQLLQGGRLLGRQAAVDDRQKIVGALDANSNPANRVSTNAMLYTSRYTAGKNFAAQQGAVAGTQAAMEAEALRDGVAAGTAAAYRGSTSRSFASGQIDTTSKLSETFGKEAGNIASHNAVHIGASDIAEDAENKANRAGGQHAGAIIADNAAAEAARRNVMANNPGATTRAAQDQILIRNAATAAGVESSRKVSQGYGQDQGVVNDLENDINNEIIDLQLARTRSGLAALPPATARAQAERTVEQRRFGAANTAARSKAERDSAKTNATERGIEEDLDEQAQTLTREAASRGTTLSRPQADALVRRRNLGAISAEAQEHSAHANRAETETAIGTQNAVETQIEEAAQRLHSGGMALDRARATARHDVETNNLRAAGTAARLKSQTETRRTNQSNIGTQNALDAQIDAEVTSSIQSGRGPISRTQAEANVTQRQLDATGIAAELEAGRKTTQEMQADIGTKNDFESQIRAARAANPTLSREQAESNVRSTRLSDAGTTARTEAERSASKQRGKEAGVARNVENENRVETDRLVKNAERIAGRRLTADERSQQASQAEVNVRDRNLGALNVEATEESASSSRAETSKAIGVKNALDAQIEEQASKLRARIAPIRTTGTAAQIAADTARFNRQVADATVRATEGMQDRNLYYAGRDAEISGQNAQAQTTYKREGTVDTYDAGLEKAPIEAARTKAYNDSYNSNKAAIAAGTMSEDQAQTAAAAAANRAASLAASTVYTGEEQRQAMITAQGVAARESAERTEATAQANVIGLNQAAKASNRLNASERITMQAENVIQSLATQSGAERARYQLTKPGEPLNRTYQEIESDTNRPELTKILADRVAIAGTKDITLPIYEVDANWKRIVEPDPTKGYVDPINNVRYKTKEMVTNRIEQAEVDPNTVPQFEAEAERLLTGPEPQIDRAIAIMKRMGLTNPGREGLRRLQYRVFGRQDDRAVDPSTLQNQGREIWEQAIKDIPHEVAPDFRAPAQAAYDGYSADAYMKAGYTTKKDAHTFALDHYEDVTLPDGTVRLGNPGFTREAVDNIMLGLSNPQTKKNVDNDNWQEMWRFLQDPRAAKIMADTTLKDAEGKDIKGTQILEEIYNQGRKYGADGKVAQRVTNAADARAYDATRPDQPPTQLFDYIPVVTARQAADYNAGPRTLTGGAPIAAGDPVPRDPANKRIDDSINYIKRELAAKGIVVP